MTLKFLTLVWIVITVWLSAEYLNVYGYIKWPDAVMLDIQCRLFGSCRRFDPRAGRDMSYALGWLGFLVMALTNLYIIRKHVHRFEKLGNIQRWLDWHIFFGLLGPTLILFHCNFKVDGLVAISFWSMVVSFTSGIIGRYFYVQILQSKSNIRRRIEGYETSFSKYIQVSRGRVSEEQMKQAKVLALYLATGGMNSKGIKQMSFLEFIGRSIVGSYNIMFKVPHTPYIKHPTVKKNIMAWAATKRKLLFKHQYQKLFGYWRTFHTPFAVFMYIVAIIHIVSSLIFKVH